MRASLIVLAQHVEEEEVDIIVQGLVVQEQLCQVAQVLAVELLLLAVNLWQGIPLNPALPATERVQRGPTIGT